MNRFEYLQKFIGNTPILELRVQCKNINKTIYAKCEWYNFSGSVKDRAALCMLENSGIKQGDEIVEVTSGNMGISLASLGAFLGLRVSIFMPKNMSEERQKIIKLYGAKLILCENFSQCFEYAQNYVQKTGAYYTKQFENKYNKIAQSKIGEEILQQCKVEAFVSGVGTSGTLSGAGELLKKNGIKLIAIDPASSSLLTLGKSIGEHKIQGLSDGIIPKLYNKNIVDEIIPIIDDDAIAMAQKLNSLGIGCGISGGANFLGCVLSNYKNVATVFADDNKKYISTDLVHEIHTQLVDSIKITLPEYN